MGLNETTRGDRIHIGIFGKRNAGKSSVINAITGQKLSIVSDVCGTTTDPVLKAMELLPLGPVMVIDTPGIDDEGELGKLRVQKTYQMLNKTDIAVIVMNLNEANITNNVDTVQLSDNDIALINEIKNRDIPYIIVLNKMDLIQTDLKDNLLYKELIKIVSPNDIIGISALTNKNIYELKEKIATLKPKEKYAYPIVRDLVNEGDVVVLITPIDSAAPKGRLILPQQQTIRELLEARAVTVVIQPDKLRDTFNKLEQKPKMVITDSQAFKQVAKETPNDVLLTSFSILMARHKGNLQTQVKGARTIEELRDGDKILISEGCTHHRQCDDIGTVKLPKLLKKYTGKELEYHFTSGTEFPTDLSEYKLVIHCGGCTLNEKEMKYRLKCAENSNIPITNYGTAIAYMNGILKRSIEVFTKESN